MRPDISLDEAQIRANAQAWREFAAAPLWAVVKGDGYGWGYARMVRACEGIAEAFCVADADELRELRRHTNLPAVILGAVTPDRLAEVLRDGGMPTISTATELEVAATILEGMGAPLRIRVGIRPAAGWSGLSLTELKSFAPALAAARAEVQVWTHISDMDALKEQLQNFHEAQRALEAAGVRVAGTDVASTIPLAAGVRGTSVRVGVGLFGSKAGAAIPGVQCAITVVAPVVRVEHHAAGTRVGYGGTMLPMAQSIATARCGYADGLPKSLAGADDILSVGMQYVTVPVTRLDEAGDAVTLLDRSRSLDAFAAQCGRLPHEIVTAFGNCARANGVSIEV